MMFSFLLFLVFVASTTCTPVNEPLPANGTLTGAPIRIRDVAFYNGYGQCEWNDRCPQDTSYITIFFWNGHQRCQTQDIWKIHWGEVTIDGYMLGTCEGFDFNGDYGYPQWKMNHHGDDGVCLDYAKVHFTDGHLKTCKANTGCFDNDGEAICD